MPRALRARCARRTRRCAWSSDATHLHPPSTASWAPTAASLPSSVSRLRRRRRAAPRADGAGQLPRGRFGELPALPCACPSRLRLAALLKTIGFEDDSTRANCDVIRRPRTAPCRWPAWRGARRGAKALAALTGAAVAPTALYKLLEAWLSSMAQIRARSTATLRGGARGARPRPAQAFPARRRPRTRERARSEAIAAGSRRRRRTPRSPPPPPRTQTTRAQRLRLTGHLARPWRTKPCSDCRGGFNSIGQRAGEGRVFSGGGRAAPAGQPGWISSARRRSRGRRRASWRRVAVCRNGEGGVCGLGHQRPFLPSRPTGNVNGEPPGRSRVRSGGVFSRPARSNKPGEGAAAAATTRTRAARRPPRSSERRPPARRRRRRGAADQRTRRAYFSVY